MWDEKKEFYCDVTDDGKSIGIRTIAGFWPLIAGVSTPSRTKSLVKHLEDPSTFNRMCRVPTLAADEAGYNPQGGYWCGAVWAPTTTMVIRGLEKEGYKDLAYEIALNHLESVSEVRENTGTIWENYAPDSINCGKPAKQSFVGWSGLGPIMYLIEYAIGLQENAQKNRLAWTIRQKGRIGCRNFRFGSVCCSVVADACDQSGKRKARVESDGSFDLIININGTKVSKRIDKGHSVFPLS